MTAYNCSPASAPVVSLKVEATGFPGSNPAKADATAAARATKGIKQVWSSTKYWYKIKVNTELYLKIYIFLFNYFSVVDQEF